MQGLGFEIVDLGLYGVFPLLVFVVVQTACLFRVLRYYWMGGPRNDWRQKDYLEKEYGWLS